MAGLASEGVVVHRLGVVATPVVAFEAARRGCLGAVISASHNPYRDNGIKLFARGGTQADRRGRAAHRGRSSPICRRRRATRPSSSTSSPARPTSSTSSAPSSGRRLDGLRIVVDAANGAASALAGPLLALTGADVVAIHDAPDGRNINAGCGATDTASLAAAVVEHGADLGLALDGDADRLVAIDHTGGVRRRRPHHRHPRHRPPRGRAAARRHRGGDRDDQPRLPARRWRRPASTSSRPPSATATCSRPSAPAATRSAASRAATSSSATSPRPATGCSPGSSCATPSTAPVARSPISPPPR